MAVSTAIVDGLDLLSGAYTVESYELPPARPNDSARADMRSGDIASPDDYDDAAYSVTVIVSADTVDAVRSAVAALTQRFAPGVMLTWAEDGSQSLNTYLREVECSDEEYRGLWARIVFTGTRDPFWHGPWYDLVPMSVPCWGSATISGAASATVVSGEVDAQLVLRATSPQATSWLGFGIKQDPAAEYAPVDDYSGVSDAVCVGGAKSASAALAATGVTVATAPVIDMAANRGNHILCVRATTTHATTTYRGSSVTSAEVGASVAADMPSVVSPSAALRGVVLGRVRTPIAEMPGLDSGWSSSTYSIAQTSGTACVFPEYSANRSDVWQTFTVTQRSRLTAIALKVTRSGMSYIDLEVMGASGGVIDTDGFVTPWPVGSGVRDVSTESGVRTIACDYVLEAGDYAIYAQCYGVAGGTKPSIWRNTDGTAYASGQAGYVGPSGVVVGDGTDTTVDLYFSLTLSAWQELGTQTPIKAAAASGNAALDVVTRIPADDLAVIATRAAAAGEGFVYDGASDDVFVGNAAGKTGASILGASGAVYGSHHGLRPSAPNLLVVAADTPPDAAPSAIAVSGQYRERWIHLAKG